MATLRDGSRHRSGGVRGRRLELPDEHVTTLDGIPITTPARTWIDCSPFVSYTDIVAMGDAILHAGLSTPKDLAVIVTWGRGRRGIRNARSALGILDAGSESPGESWVRAMLVSAGVRRPVCNLTVTIQGHHFRLDLAWPKEKVAVEYDGEEFHGPERRDRDEWRRALLQDAGWVVIVVRKADLADAQALVRTVSAALIHAQ